jgi:hypothetical protein
MSMTGDTKYLVQSKAGDHAAFEANPLGICFSHATRHHYHLKRRSSLLQHYRPLLCLGQRCILQDVEASNCMSTIIRCVWRLLSKAAIDVSGFFGCVPTSPAVYSSGYGFFSHHQRKHPEPELIGYYRRAWTSLTLVTYDRGPYGTAKEEHMAVALTTPLHSDCHCTVGSLGKA